jgi:hypothetical protein
MKNIFTLFIFLVSYLLQGQDMQAYENIYRVADDMTKSGKVGIIENDVFYRTLQLDSKPPLEYFNLSGEYLENLKYNEASFLYYLGALRYSFYNKTNPNYSPSNDGALAGSLMMVMGEAINMYLRTNIDNFISILESVKRYYLENDFEYFSKSKNEENYNAQATDMQEKIDDLKANKSKYSKDWKKERKEMEALMKKLSK